MSSSGVAGRDGSRLRPSVLKVSGAALLRRVCVKVKMPSAYALSTGFLTVRRGETGEVGVVGDCGNLFDEGKVDASGVGSTPSGSSSGSSS